jgi:hypothetical protein
MGRPDVPASLLPFALALAIVFFAVTTSSVALGQAPAANPKPPTTAPAPAPAALPSPKAVAIAFAASLDKGDAAVAKALIPPDSVHTSWLDASLALSAALRSLDAAATARFGDAAGKGVTQDRLHLADAAKALEGAQEKMEGDQATLTLPGHSEPIELKKVDGKWQLRVGPANQGEAQRQIAFLRRLTDATSRTAKEVASGTYPDAEAAAQVFAGRVLDARLAH